MSALDMAVSVDPWAKKQLQQIKNEIERLRKQLAETESHLESLQNRFEQVTAENEQLRERNLLLNDGWTPYKR